MNIMTGKERISRILKRQPIDRIGLYEHFWGEVDKKWRAEGHIKPGEEIDDHFNFDIELMWALNLMITPDFKPEIIEEDADTRLERDGNRAILRRHKKHTATPEHVDFHIKDRQSWETDAKPFLTPTRNRINFQDYKNEKKRAEKAQRFFMCSGVNVFEAIHPVCGHEHMLMGMGLDPDWIKDMTDTYADMIIQLWKILFAECGQPDGIWFYEDMGFKGRPFMSPDMYRELIMPAHKKTIDYAHSLGLPVVMHSCGFIEPLLPHVIEAGIDALQVIENKAGMDLLKIKKEFGDKIVLFGGMDARNLVANNIKAIDEELHSKIPVVMQNSGYILHSDHSITDQCEYTTYRHFVDEALKLGTYK